MPRNIIYQNLKWNWTDILWNRIKHYANSFHFFLWEKNCQIHKNGDFKVIIFICWAWSEYDIFRLRITYLVIGWAQCWMEAMLKESSKLGKVLLQWRRAIFRWPLQMDVLMQMMISREASPTSMFGTHSSPRRRWKSSHSAGWKLPLLL